MSGDSGRKGKEGFWGKAAARTGGNPIQKGVSLGGRRRFPTLLSGGMDEEIDRKNSSRRRSLGRKDEYTAEEVKLWEFMKWRYPEKPEKELEQRYHEAAGVIQPRKRPEKGAAKSLLTPHDTGSGWITPSIPSFEDAQGRTIGGVPQSHQGKKLSPDVETLYFDGDTLFHFDEKGRLLGKYEATTGQFGKGPYGLRFPESFKKSGPIPPGLYFVKPDEIRQPKTRYHDAFAWNNPFRDWGKYRVKLHPAKGTNTHGRTEFFLHGGRKPGSEGCIDIGQADKELFPKLLKGQKPIAVMIFDYDYID